MHGHAIERTCDPRERECFVSIKDGANARKCEPNERVNERDFREWRASGNLRSCDRYKQNIFLFPGIII